MADEKAGSVQELERSVETLESQMREQIARTRAGATTSLIVGIIIVAIIGIIYFTYGGGIKEAMEPDYLVEALSGMADEPLMDLVDGLEGTLKKDAPANVTQLRGELMKQVPGLRKQIEDVAVAKIDEAATTLDKKADEIVDEILAAQKKELTELIEVAVQKQSAEPLEKAFRKSLEDLIGREMDDMLKKFHREMGAIEIKLDRLLRPVDQLGDEEKFERQCIEKMLIYIDDIVTESAKPTKPG